MFGVKLYHVSATKIRLLLFSLALIRAFTIFDSNYKQNKESIDFLKVRWCADLTESLRQQVLANNFTEAKKITAIVDKAGCRDLELKKKIKSQPRFRDYTEFEELERLLEQLQHTQLT